MKLSLTIGKIEMSYEEVPEKLCHQCGECWPATSEFFFNRDGHFYSPCIACQNEKTAQRNMRKKCVIEGCNNHRATGYSKRCGAHYRQHRKKVQP